MEPLWSPVVATGATGRKWRRRQNRRNKRKPLPWAATGCREQRVVRRGSTVRVRQRGLQDSEVELLSIVEDMAIRISRRLSPPPPTASITFACRPSTITFACRPSRVSRVRRQTYPLAAGHILPCRCRASEVRL
jgi:hypothetical protein